MDLVMDAREKRNDRIATGTPVATANCEVA